MSVDIQDVINKLLDGEITEHHHESDSIDKTRKKNIFKVRSLLVNIVEDEEDKDKKQIVEDEEDKDKKQTVIEILRRTDGFEIMLHHIKMWEANREDLLTLLNDSELGTISKWGAGGRFITCAINIGSIVAGLLLENTDSISAKWLLHAATFSGNLGLVSTLLEILMLNKKFKRIKELLERDQQLFAPIRNWYQQTEELETAMLDLFPFALTENILLEEETSFPDLVETVLGLLSAVVKPESFFQREISFTDMMFSCLIPGYHRNSDSRLQSLVARFKRIFYLFHHPFNYLIIQSIKALASEKVWVIYLDAYPIVDAIQCFWSYENPLSLFAMRGVKEYLLVELQVLQSISNVCQIRRNMQRSYVA